MRNPELIIAPAAFILIGFVIWMVANAWQRRLQVKLVTDFNSRLLDRIGSVKDFSEFLQTDGGAKLLDSLTVERSAAIRPQHGILRALQTGIVLAMLGLGLLGLGWYFSVRYASFGDYAVLTVIGVIALSLGAGFMLAAAASYRVASMLGAFDQGSHQRSTDVASR